MILNLSYQDGFKEYLHLSISYYYFFSNLSIQIVLLDIHAPEIQE
jgi:hypothetical protein